MTFEFIAISAALTLAAGFVIYRVTRTKTRGSGDKRGGGGLSGPRSNTDRK